jgi:hypothetical protein
MGEVTHIPDSRAATLTILRELDWAYESQMVLIDLIGDIPGRDQVVNYPNLRAISAQRLRESIERRDAAVAVLDGEAS